MTPGRSVSNVRPQRHLVTFMSQSFIACGGLVASLRCLAVRVVVDMCAVLVMLQVPYTLWALSHLVLTA